MIKDINDTIHSLLPCPFCGEDGTICTDLSLGISAIECDNCRASSRYDTEIAVRMAWNNRHNSHNDLVNALKELMEIAGFYIEYMDEPNDIVIACDRIKAAKQALEKAGVTL